MSESLRFIVPGILPFVLPSILSSVMPALKTVKRLCLGIVLSSSVLWAAAPAWSAPYVWLSTTQSSAQLHVGGLAAGDSADPKPLLQTPRAMMGDSSTPLAPHPDTDGYVMALPFGNDTDVRFTADALDSQGNLTIYEARAGRQGTHPLNHFELVPVDVNGNTFQLFWQGKPVQVGTVTVETSSGWWRVLHPAADGTISLTSPDFPTLFPAQYVLQAVARIDDPTTFQGKTYPSVIHVATLSFDVSGH